MTEPWPFRDAILAAWALKDEAFACIEGCDADELALNETIIEECGRFERALSGIAPDAYIKARQSIKDEKLG